MPKKYTVLINDDNVIRKLNSIPERSKGAYITEAIKEKISRDNNVIINEELICKIVRREIEKILNSTR